MGCTDGLPDDYEESRVSYEVWQEVVMKTRQEATKVVEDMIEKEENEHAAQSTLAFPKEE